MQDKHKFSQISNELYVQTFTLEGRDVEGGGAGAAVFLNRKHHGIGVHHTIVGIGADLDRGSDLEY